MIQARLAGHLAYVFHTLKGYLVLLQSEEGALYQINKINKRTLNILKAEALQVAHPSDFTFFHLVFNIMWTEVIKIKVKNQFMLTGCLFQRGC